MKILFLGDIVGRAGRDAVLQGLPEWRESLKLDAVVVNGENSCHGFGISSKIAKELLEAGVDAITLGNHAWDCREFIGQIDQFPQIVRPINFPIGTPGKGHYIFQIPTGQKIMVINVMGRIFMDPLDDPFRTVSELLVKYPLGKSVNAIIVDVHAEATSEKMGLGFFLDGHVSLVVGTHTHVPTSDHRILPNGTAYQTDAGMCGDYDSIIGMEKERALGRLLKKIPYERAQPALGEATTCGLYIETDDKTGLALKIVPFRQGGLLSQNFPK